MWAKGGPGDFWHFQHWCIGDLTACHLKMRLILVPTLAPELPRCPTCLEAMRLDEALRVLLCGE